MRITQALAATCLLLISASGSFAECFLIVASDTDRLVATQMIQKVYATDLRKTQLLLVKNGRYAVSLGILQQEPYSDVSALISQRSLPADTFCLPTSDVVEVVDIAIASSSGRSTAAEIEEPTEVKLDPASPDTHITPYVLAFVVLGGLLLLFRQVHSKNESGLPKAQLRTTREPPAVAKRSTPPRFDEKSAKHLHHKRVLVGAAYVIDGDTIRLKKTQVRLFGIDAPELNHPHGKNAKWALHRLCKGQIVRAEIVDQDAYGRTVAHCYLPDGRDISAEMVKLGLAIDWPKFSGGKFQHLEQPEARKKLFLADARQKGRMHVWKKFEAEQGRQ